MLEKNKTTENTQTLSWSPWDYTKVFLATAGTLAVSYVGFGALASLWQSAPELDVNADIESDIMPDLSQRNLIGRHLLSTTENVTVVNPVPDLQFEATVNDDFFLDGSVIYSGDILGIGVVNEGNQTLPSWLRFDMAMGSYNILSSIQALAVQGSIAYVVDHALGLQVLDASDPSNIMLLGSFGMSRSFMVTDIFVQNNMVYAMLGSLGLQIVDVTNLASIVLLASYDTPGWGKAVDVQNNIAYVADGTSGLQVLDVSNPASIALLGAYEALEGALDVVVDSNIAYVVVGFSGLQILDVSIPTNIVLLGSYDTPGTAVDVFFDDYVAYVSDGSSGLQILDVSNPASIVFLGNYGTPGKAGSVFLQSSVMFVMDSIVGLQILDVSTPSNIMLLGNYYMPQYTTEFVIQGRTVFIGSGINLEILNLYQGKLVGTATTALVGQIYELELIAYGSESSLVKSTFTLTVNQLPRRRVNELSAQSLFPNQDLSLNLDSDALFIDPDNNLLVLSAALFEQSSLPVWLEVLSEPTFMANVDTLGSASNIVVQGNIAYVAEGYSGFETFDVSNPANIKLLGRSWASLYVNAIFIQDSVAYIIDLSLDSGLRIMDVSDPSRIVFLGSFSTTPGQAHDVVVHDSVAYVACDFFGVQVLDVSNPASILLLGSYDTPGNAIGVAVQDSIVYVADEASGLQVLDVSNPLSIVLLGSYGTSGEAYSVFIRGSVAYVAYGTSGLQVLDVTNPESIVLLDSYDTSGHAYDVVVHGSVAYLSDGGSGLMLFDVSNLESIKLLGNYDTPGLAQGVNIQGNIAFVADWTMGFRILDLTTWALTANPTDVDVGNYDITITATDELGGTASDGFRLRVEGPPTFSGSLINQRIATGDAYNYFIPQGLVTDPNNDPISFDAQLAGGVALPGWLGFNSFSATFAGTPDVAGVLNITVSATDNIAGSTSTHFILSTHYKPQVSKPLVDPSPWREGKAFNYTMPKDAFLDLNGNALRYSASLGNQASLPSWLSFDGNTGTFSGQPPTGSAAKLTVVVTATDTVLGFSASQFFTLQVAPNQAPEVKNPLGGQTATVGDVFRYVVPDTTFGDPNGDGLSYTASGMPKWLRFFPKQRRFEGKPGYADQASFGNKVDQVSVTATDGEVSESTPIHISIDGDSTLTLLLKVGSPIFGTLSVLFSVYLYRAMLLNCINQGKDQQQAQHVELGAVGDRIALHCLAGRVSSFEMQVPRKAASNCFENASRCFSRMRKLPGGELPYWLAYRAESNVLEVVAPGPSAGDAVSFNLRVLDESGYLLEEFSLHVGEAAGNELDTGTELTNLLY